MAAACRIARFQVCRRIFPRFTVIPRILQAKYSCNVRQHGRNCDSKFTLVSQFHYSAQYWQKCSQCSANMQKPSLVCDKCSSIQPDYQKLTYFEVLNEPQRFKLDERRLQQTFRELQKVFHPDKLAGKTDEEKELSANVSAFVNQAYQVLQKPISRAKYLLKLHQKHLDDVHLSGDFLSRMMELNEQLMEGDSEVEVDKELAELWKKIEMQFEAMDMDSALNTLAQIKYLDNIRLKKSEYS